MDSAVEKEDFGAGIPIFRQNDCEVEIGSVEERVGRRVGWDCWERERWHDVMCADPFG